VYFEQKLYLYQEACNRTLAGWNESIYRVSSLEQLQNLQMQIEKEELGYADDYPSEEMPVLQEFKRVVKLVSQSKKQVLDNCQARMFQMEQELREEEERLRRDTVDKLQWDA
jgi:hypothetical protein